jgi:hypothetical protein
MADDILRTIVSHNNLNVDLSCREAMEPECFSLASAISDIIHSSTTMSKMALRFIFE